MKELIILLLLQATMSLFTFSTPPSDTLKNRYKITILTREANKINGILLKTTNEAVTIYPGSFNRWKHNEDPVTLRILADQIQEIKLRERNSPAKGILIGAGIGICPLIASSLLGRGEGGAYISVITFPLGIILGIIIGASSKKKFNISGNHTNFLQFLEKIR